MLATNDELAGTELVASRVVLLSSIELSAEFSLIIHYGRRRSSDQDVICRL